MSTKVHERVDSWWEEVELLPALEEEVLVEVAAVAVPLLPLPAQPAQLKYKFIRLILTLLLRGCFFLFIFDGGGGKGSESIYHLLFICENN